MKKLIVIAVSLYMLAAGFAQIACASVEEGDALAAEGKYMAAIDQYDKALKKDPGNAEILAKAAEAADKHKWYGRSVQYWETLLEKAPDSKHAGKAKERSAFARRWLGVYLYETGGEIDPVLEQLDAALGHDPGYYDALYWKGRILFETGRFEEAVKALKKAVDAAPSGNRLAAWLLQEAKGAADNGEAYTVYSDAYKYFESGKYDKALQMYGQAVKLNPDFARPYEYMARIFMANQNYARALEYWDMVLEKEPDNKRAAWFKKVSEKELKNQQ